MGNLKLNNDVVLFDVLVVPEYCVSLLSVHKLIKYSKLSVSFDKCKCRIRDLKEGRVLGTGSEFSGLYVFDNEFNKCASVNQRPYRVVSREGFRYFLTVVDDYTRLPSFILNGKSPFCLVYGREPNLSYLRSFRCLCYARIVKESDNLNFFDFVEFETQPKTSAPSPNDEEEGPSGSKDGSMYQPEVESGDSRVDPVHSNPTSQTGNDNTHTETPVDENTHSEGNAVHY
ncbi:hypothetical protein Tco_1575450 [Tanacetum coccineum]